MSTLNPYSGIWSTRKAAYLLNRTTFGANKALVDHATTQGLDVTIQELLNIEQPESLPIHTNFEEDPVAPPGSSWVYKVVRDNPPMGLQGARRRSLLSWWIGLIHEAGISIREKMVLFLHEHFAISDIDNANVAYQYIELLRNYALGNFKQLMKEMTICPAMLLFLNGFENTKENPNENYARELLELFSIGRGTAVAEGDYTNYTEHDIREIARILTGWSARYSTENVPEGFFIPPRHDTGIKTLSHRFDNVSIANEGEKEFEHVIDIIFSYKETARFICRKLHIWFVGSDINSEVEANIIEPLADILYDHDYEMKPVLEALLSSEYFLDGGHEGCMISSPLDFIFKIVRTFNVSFSDDINLKYRAWAAVYNIAAGQDMALLYLPSVAGWKAFYQEPGYYQYWINSFSLSLRKQVADILVYGNGSQEANIQINPLTFVGQIENAEDPNVLINAIAEILYPVPLGEEQIKFLKESLIPGLPDFEWTVEYLAYLADPENQDKKNSVFRKLAIMILAMLNMPEIHLM